MHASAVALPICSVFFACGVVSSSTPHEHAFVVPADITALLVDVASVVARGSVANVVILVILCAVFEKKPLTKQPEYYLLCIAVINKSCY